MASSPERAKTTLNLTPTVKADIEACAEGAGMSMAAFVSAEHRIVRGLAQIGVTGQFEVITDNGEHHHVILPFNLSEMPN